MEIFSIHAPQRYISVKSKGKKKTFTGAMKRVVKYMNIF